MANVAYEARDRAQSETGLLKLQAAKEQAEAVQEANLIATEGTGGGSGENLTRELDDLRFQLDMVGTDTSPGRPNHENPCFER